jgi:hypothetical protein
MITCFISGDAMLALRKVVAKLLYNQSANNSLNVKEVVKKIYDHINKTTNHATALDYAKQVPSLISQITAFDLELLKLMKPQIVELIDVLEVFEKDTDGTAISNYLGLQDNVTEEVLQELNETNDVSETEDTVTASDQTPELEETVDEEIVSSDASVTKNPEQSYNAAVAVLLTDSVREADFGTKGKKDGTNRVPYQSQEKNFAVKRKILTELDGQPSDEKPVNGVKLVLANAQDVTSEDTGFEIGSDEVVLTITNTFGEVVKFDDSFLPAKEGTPVYYKLRNPKNYIDADGKLTLLANESIASIKNTLDVSEATAEAMLRKELDLLNDLIEAHAAGKKLSFVINGGTQGYIKFDERATTPLSEVKETITLEKGINIPGTNDKQKGYVFITTPSLQGSYIKLEAPGIAQTPYLETVVSLAVDDLIDSVSNKSITQQQRLILLERLLYANSKGSKRNAPIQLIKDTPNKILINGVTFTINTSIEKEIAAKEIRNILNEVNAGFYKHKLNLNTSYADKKTFDLPVINVTDQGNKVVSDNSTMSYEKFLASAGVAVATPDISSDGKLRKLNAYFTLSLTEQTASELYNNDIKKESDTIVEQANAVSAKSDAVIPDDFFNATNKEELFKTAEQKRDNQIVTKAQEQTAQDWYEQSPLKDYIKLHRLQHVVNSKGGVATWSMQGITLYKGSDNTDIYHEAWHGFSQAFMNKTQRAELYKSVRSKTGTFKSVDGRNLYFAKADDLQIEEYLAEQFREYVLTGGKNFKGTGKEKSLFSRIWNVLKALFSDNTISEITLDAQSNEIIRTMFEKLKTNNVSEYTFSYDNSGMHEFNTGISSIESNAAGESKFELNYQDSKTLLNLIDSGLAEFIDGENSNLSIQEKLELTDLELLIQKADKGLLELRLYTEGDQIGRYDIEAKIEAYQKRKTSVYTGRITQNKDTLTRGYFFVKHKIARTLNDFNNQADALLEQLKTTKDETAKASITNELASVNNNIKLLEFAFTNFNNGSEISLEANDPTKTNKGLIAYHRYKTELFKEDMSLDNDYDNEDEAALKSKEKYDRKGNDQSLREMAKFEIIYLLKTLPGYKVSEDGIFEAAYDRFGSRDLADFRKTFNRIARATENSVNFKDFYYKLLELSATYPPVRDLINRLGNPEGDQTITETVMWTNLWQTFNKARIKLVQLTADEKKKSEFSKDTNFTIAVGEAMSSDKKVLFRWQADFMTNPKTPFIISTDAGNHLNIKGILDNFTLAEAQADPYAFYTAVGFDLSDNEDIRKILKDKSKFKTYNPRYVYETLQKLADKKVQNLKDLGADSNIINNLTQLEARYSDVFSNFAVSNAENNTQYEHSLNNTLSILTNSVNAVNTYAELLATPHLAHLDVRRYLTESEAEGMTNIKRDSEGRIINPRFNPGAAASLWLKSIFEFDVTKDGLVPRDGIGKKKLFNGVDVSLRLTNLSGVLVKTLKNESGNGIASASADEYTKLIMDLHMSLAGYPELMRHADKSTSFSVTLAGLLEGNNKLSESYIPLESFDMGREDIAFYNRILPHLKAEMQRIQIMKNLDVDQFDYNYQKAGTEFNMFHDVLTKDLRDTLSNILITEIEDRLANVDLQNQIINAIGNYMAKQETAVLDKFNEAPFIATNILGKRSKETLIKSFVYNNWIHNAESIAFIYGDLAQYNHEKEEFHKRNAGSGSTGTIYRGDQVMQNLANGRLWESSYAKKVLKLADNPAKFDGTLKTAIVEDMGIATASEDVQSYLDAVSEKGKKYISKYGSKQNEADAQGLITFDAYRLLKVAEGTWSPEHEILFRTILDGKPVKNSDVKKFFPVIKAQYWGPLKTDTIPLTAFHKYSLFPMIPTAIKGTNMQIVHDRMVREGISYLTFQSGSKINTVTNKKGADKLYSDQQNRVLEPNMSSTDTKVKQFTPNVIHIQYLKNQLEIADKAKGKVIFSTQLRKLIEDGLMENGVPTDYRKDITDNTKRMASWKQDLAKGNVTKNYKLLQTYEQNLTDLTQFAKDALLEEMGWTNDDLKKDEVSGDKLNKLLDLVKSELSRQDLGEHSISFIKLGPDGKLAHDLSLNLNAERIEKLLTALMVKRIVKQKVNGEALIQVANTLMEKSFTGATDEDMQKYKAAGLPFYKPSATGTKAMKVKVSLSDNFEILLKAKDLDGKPIGSIDKLNKLIKDEAWLNIGDNRKMITLVAVRIPVQGLNSMEFMEVYEFLPKEAGTIIVPPTEIVTKSGADFDVDKMTVMMPNLLMLSDGPVLYKRSETKLSKADLKKQKLEIFEKIKSIRNSYKDIFDRHDSKNEFAFTPEQKEALTTIHKQIADVQAKQYQLYKTTTDITSDEFYSDMNALNKQLENLEFYKKETVRNWNNIKTTQFFEKQAAELAPLMKELDKITLAQASYKKDKAIQNDIISNISEILSLPENFESLMTPNSTDIFTAEKGIVDETRETAMEYNPLNQYTNEGRRTVRKKDRDISIISPTRVLEIPYNLYKHTSNNIGKQTLGLGAVDNTYNSLLNRIGMYLNPAITKTLDDGTVITDELNLLLPHNTITVDGKPAISLSHLQDVDGDKGNKISDVINQLMNGWVDIAKDAWVFSIQANKELAPALLFLVQAGVPIKDAVYFLSNPLIRKYVNEQKLAKSTFASVLGKGTGDITRVKKQALSAVVSNPDNGLAKQLITKKGSADLGYVKKQLAGKKLGNLKDMGLSKINRQITDADRDVFYHFLQIEKMAEAVRDIKLNTNVDTSRDVSLFAAKERIGKLKDLSDNAYLPTELIDELLHKSPISSFYISHFQLNLLGRLFPLRNNKTLNNWVSNVSKKSVDETYQNKLTYTVNWKSDLLNTLFQSELRYFDINNITHYQGQTIASNTPLENVYLEKGVFEKDGVMYVDKQTLFNQFANQSFLKNTYTDYGVSLNLSTGTFTSKDEYAHYVLEKEHLRNRRSLTQVRNTVSFEKQLLLAQGKLKNDNVDAQTLGLAYEMYLSDLALDNIFNHWKIFNSSNSYAVEFKDIQKAYPGLVNDFMIFSSLSIREDKTITNLILNDANIEGDDINVLHDNVNDLTDYHKLLKSVPSLTPVQAIEIINFFEKLQTVAFLQSGMNIKSGFALTKFVPQTKMLTMLDETIKNFMTFLNNDTKHVSNYLKAYDELFFQQNKVTNRRRRIRGKNMTLPVSFLKLNRSSVTKLTESLIERASQQVEQPILTMSSITVGNRDDDSLFNVNTVTEQTLINEPNTVFVFSSAVADNIKAANKTSEKLINFPQTNKFGLPIKSRFGIGNWFKDDVKADKKTTINQDVKDTIDTAIAQLKMESSKEGVTLKFSDSGYGTEMIYDKKEGVQTFLYLSEQLYKNFGYINPGYLRSYEAKVLLQSKQNITDVKIKEVTSKDVEDALKQCLK